MKTLQEIWDEMPLKSDKGDVHSYLPVYEEILAPYRHTAKNVLEIGLFNGASMLLWEQYFTNARVYGIDCDELPHGGLADLRPMIKEGTHYIHIIDAEKPFTVLQIFGYVKFDVIIEDAGHEVNQQLNLYKIWKHYIAPGGVYVIEDIQDIDATREKFENIDPEKEVTILDKRHIKNRYDDVLVIIKDK